MSTLPPQHTLPSILSLSVASHNSYSPAPHAHISASSSPVPPGAKDVRISIDLDAATPVATAVSFDQLQSVLRGDAVGAEFLNGRVAMVAFLACSAVELATQKTVLEQALTPVGGVGALALVSLTFAASIAPALAGAPGLLAGVPPCSCVSAVLRACLQKGKGSAPPLWRSHGVCCCHTTVYWGPRLAV